LQVLTHFAITGPSGTSRKYGIRGIVCCSL
jgi:hypothetical protein